MHKCKCRAYEGKCTNVNAELTKENAQMEIEGAEEVDVLKRKSSKIAAFLSACLPKGTGFALFLFSYGNNDEVHSISNVPMEKLLQVLNVFAKRAKQGSDQGMPGSKSIH
jgi:hypothetical protein